MNDSVLALWREYERTGSLKARNKILEHYLPHVRAIVQEIRRDHLVTTLDIDDLMAAGVFGLLAAIESCSAEESARFETDCDRCVRNAILKDIELDGKADHSGRSM